MFQADAPAQLSAVETAIQRKDSVQLQEAAHKLRGLVSAFSTTTAVVVESLEQMGAEGRSADAANEYSIAAQHVRDLLASLPTLTLEQLRS